MQIPLSSPCITDVERQAVLSVLDSPSLSLGPKLREFEAGFSAFTGAREAVAVNSGTSGLHLCMKAVGIDEGSEVITTPFSFVASANCVLFERGTPVFVDIDPETLNIDPKRIEAAITTRTKAVLPVHVFGRPCEMDPILEIANRRHLHVVEDSCEAIGATYKGRHVGTLGDSGVFAFYPNKQMTTGEGGMIVTSNAETATLCRSWRNQGRGESSTWLQHERLGYNYRLSDINCALGLAQLSRLGEILRFRSSAANLYTELLKDAVPEVLTPAAAEPGSTLSWFVYVVRLQPEFNRTGRDSVLEQLRGLGIGCSNYFTPIHLQPFYRKQFGFCTGDFPITEAVADRTIALPFYSGLKPDQIVTVCGALQKAIHSVKRSSICMSVQGA